MDSKFIEKAEKLEQQIINGSFVATPNTSDKSKTEKPKPRK